MFLSQNKRTHYFEHQLLPEHSLVRKVVDGVRYYDTPDGKSYPSVTTVLSSLTKNKMLQWQENVGEEQANKIKTQAANRGTGTHAVCENYLLNKDDYLRGQMPTSISMFKQIQPYLDKHIGKVYGIEIPLYSHKLRSAGSCDLLCQLHGINAVVDFKTSTNPKKEEWIENYFYQATAYAIMAEEMYNITVPSIGILIAVENGDFQFFLKQTAQYKEIVTSYFQQYQLQ